MTLAVSLFVAVADVLVSMSKVYSSTYLSDMGEAEAEVFRTEFDYALENCQEFKIYSSVDQFSAAGQPANSGNLLLCNMGLNPTKYLLFWFQPDQSGASQGKLCYGESAQPSLPAVYATFHDPQYSPYEAFVNTDLFSMAVEPTGQPSGLVSFSYSVNFEMERVSYTGISYALSMR
jgi:hypothetical protein